MLMYTLKWKSHFDWIMVRPKIGNRILKLYYRDENKVFRALPREVFVSVTYGTSIPLEIGFFSAPKDMAKAVTDDQFRTVTVSLDYLTK